jgi:hypothetical protein
MLRVLPRADLHFPSTIETLLFYTFCLLNLASPYLEGYIAQALFVSQFRSRKKSSRLLRKKLLCEYKTSSEQHA